MANGAARADRIPPAAVVLLATFAVAADLVLGRVGLIPIDQSIVFGLGWRFAVGQVPFRDFTTPAGLVPGLLQAAAFRLAGVSWWSYLGHAAVANAAFAVSVASVLRRERVRRPLALAAAALSALLFYPTVRTPYLEHHAMLFGWLALGCAPRAEATGEPGRPALRGLAGGALLALAFLSKQNPTVYLAALLPWMIGPRPGRGRWLVGAGLGAATIALGVGLVLAAERASLASAFAALWTTPSALGRGRWLAILRDEGVALAAARTVGGLGAWPLAGLVGGALALGSPPSDRAGARDARRLRARWALGLLAVTLLFLLTTFRTPWSGLAFLPPAVALLAENALASRGVAAGGRSRARSVAGVAVVAALLVATADVARRGLGATDAEALAALGSLGRRPAGRSAGAAIPRLRGLAWTPPFAHATTLAELAALVADLRDAPGSFFLVSDLVVIPALVGAAPVEPVAWWHPGLTFPVRATGGPATRRFELEMFDALVRARARRIVIEPAGTIFGVGPATFPELASVVGSTLLARRRIGPFEILELRAGWWESPRLAAWRAELLGPGATSPLG